MADFDKKQHLKVQFHEKQTTIFSQVNMPPPKHPLIGDSQETTLGGSNIVGKDLNKVQNLNSSGKSFPFQNERLTSEGHQQESSLRTIGKKVKQADKMTLSDWR